MASLTRLFSKKAPTNLTEASLFDLCRSATSRHIEQPDELLNQQVVYSINLNAANPAATREAYDILVKRLNMDNPQKQYLAVVLTGKVLSECHAAIGGYQGALLQEVAQVMAKPRGMSPAASRCKQACMDLLRAHGPAGQDALRVARMAGRPAAPPPGVAPQTMVYGGMQPPGLGPLPQGTGADSSAASATRESLIDEVRRMSEQAKGSSELLNELLVNKTAPGARDEFESTLSSELLSDVKTMREALAAYLDQLGSFDGADAEVAIAGALEAVDALDAALALERDVAAEIKTGQEQGLLTPDGTLSPRASSAAAGAGVGAAAAAASAAAVATRASVPRPASLNLIDFDDEDAAPAPAPAAAGASAAQDPFAAAPAAGGPPAQDDPFALLAAAAPGAQAPPAGAQAPDPFAGGAPPGWGAPPPPAAAAAAPPPAYGAVSELTAKSPWLQQGLQQQAPPSALAPAAAAEPPPPPAATATAVFAPGPLAAAAYPPAQPAGGVYGQQQQPPPPGTGAYLPQATGGYYPPPAPYMQHPGYPPQHTGAYGAAAPYAAPQQPYGAPPSYGYAAPAYPSQPPPAYAAAPPPQPTSPPGGNPNNPFTSGGGAPGGSGGDGANPFGATAAPVNAAAVDAEWNKLFAANTAQSDPFDSLASRR